MNLEHKEHTKSRNSILPKQKQKLTKRNPKHKRQTKPELTTKKKQLTKHFKALQYGFMNENIYLLGNLTLGNTFFKTNSLSLLLLLELI